MKFRLISLNCRGLHKKKKRQIIFKKCSNFDIACLQETYVTEKVVKEWERDWQGKLFYIEGTNRSKGQIILINKHFEADKIEIVHRAQRVLVVRIQKGDKLIDILNVYAPAVKADRANFLSEVTSIIKKINNNNLIICGDFNNYLSELDNVAGEPKDASEVRGFNNWVQAHGLVDCWRSLNESVKDFSWSRGSPVFIGRRLDFCFISEELKTGLAGSKHEIFFATDHKGVAVNFCFSDFKRGPSYWKFNDSLLEDEIYIYLINDLIKKESCSTSGEEEDIKWELLKAKIRGATIEFGIQKKRESKNRLAMLTKRLDELSKTISQNNGNEELDLVTEYYKTKKELDILEANKVAGAQLRAKQKWIEEGEKNSKFFFDLEKARGSSNIINRLKLNDEVTVETPHEILPAIKQFYQTLYTKDEEVTNVKEKMNTFMENENLPQLSDYFKETCDRSFSIEEMDIALRGLNSDSSPGSDGLTKAFYEKFWQNLRPLLYKCLQKGIGDENLSTTMKRGVITLIPKSPDLPRDKLTNWRPVTLTNVDYKIFSRVLYNRLVITMDSLIHNDQVGFLKGRSMANHIRTIDDVISLAKEHHREGIVTSLDYQKAFDSIEKATILHTLKLFNFGPFFIKLIKTLISNTEACVQNGGWLSGWFSTSRGIRQGCGVSPLLFILVVELLATKIRNDDTIEKVFLDVGSVKCLNPKLVQLADDMSLILKNWQSLKKALQIIDTFTTFSGLKLNKNKCNSMLIGGLTSSKNIEYGIPILKEHENLKILGIYFNCKREASHIEQNWVGKFNTMQKIISRWQRRSLSLYGKIIIAKTFILSIWTHVIQCLALPETVLKDIDAVIFKFLWQKKHSNKRSYEKIKRAVLCLPVEEGGLGMISVIDKQTVFLFKWLSKGINKERGYSISNMFFQKFYGINYFLETDPGIKEVNTNNIPSIFWLTAATKWLSFKGKHFVQQNLDIENQPIFHNSNILYKNKCLNIKRWKNAGIGYVKDIYKNNRLLSMQEIEARTGGYPGLMFDYLAAYNAVNNFLEKNRSQQEGPEEVQVKKESMKEEITKFIHKSNKDIRHALIVQKNITICGAHFWKNKYNFEVQNNFNLAVLATRESRLRLLHFKILHNIYPTNILLKRMKIKENELCETCKERDYIEHFFVHCRKLRGFWSGVQNTILKMTDNKMQLTDEDILMGISTNSKDISKEATKIANEIILIAKMSISKMRYRSEIYCRDITRIFEEELSIRGYAG
ncbi:MAG: hypothetical protein GY705_20955 [Bacteroidetes bacterium]|nr:hypothetical protein [Bacteroidota bacterium]